MYRIDYAVGAESKRSHILIRDANEIAKTIQWLKDCGCIVLTWFKF